MTARTAITAGSSFGGSHEPTATIFRCGGGGGTLSQQPQPPDQFEPANPTLRASPPGDLKSVRRAASTLTVGRSHISHGFRLGGGIATTSAVVKPSRRARHVNPVPILRLSSCKNCGVAYSRIIDRRVDFCTPLCAAEFRADRAFHRKRENPKTRTCCVCQAQFVKPYGRRGRRTTCSADCRLLLRRAGRK